MLRTVCSLAALTAFLVLVGAQPAWAAPGDPDTSFSLDGKAAFDILGGGTNDSIEGVAVGSNGKVVGVGDVSPGGGGRSKLLVVRLRANGALDPTFSGDGVAVFGMPGDTWGESVTMGSRGTILVVGANETASGASALVWRLTPGGKLDSRFSGDGVARVKAAGAGYGEAITVSGGSIYVAGSLIRDGVANAMMVARLTSRGRMDPAFSGDGVALARFDTGDAWPTALAVHDGEPVVAGSVAFGSGYGYGAARFTATGQHDPSFSADGEASMLVDAIDWSEGQDLLVAHDGSLLIGGFTYDGTDYAHAFVRFTSAGMPDGTFGGGDGLLVTDPTPGSDWFGEMVKRGSGFVVAGSAVFGTNPDIALFAYSAAGTLDPTFGGGDGIARLRIAPYSVAYALARDGNGRYVAAGRRFDLANTENDVAFVRVLGP